MKNILVIIGSANINGNTNELADAFIKGALDANHHVQKVYLNGNLQGCLGCQACQHNGHKCVIQDKMQEIYPLFEQADTIVLASPLYFWTISARLKCFIDRLYAISTNDEYPFKNTLLLMSAGSEEFFAFEQAVSFYRFFTKALKWQDNGMVLAYNCDKKDNKNIIDKKYLHEAYNLGKNLK